MRPGGSFELYKDKHGFVLGTMEGMKYKTYEMQLEPGSKLFVYTDGVPEATNDREELMGTDRMLEALNKDVLSFLLRAFIPLRDASEQPREARPQPRNDMSRLQTRRNDLVTNGEQAARTPVRAEKKVGRNDPCPCGSGLKYKNCRGKGILF
jgi:preprotein translocase subunit SecA